MKRVSTAYINRLLNLALGGILMVLAASCAEDYILDPSQDPADNDCLKLTTGSSVTRADDGHIGTDDPFMEAAQKQEDRIATAELYFFSSADDEEPAFYHATLSGIDQIATAKINLKLPLDKISDFLDVEGSTSGDKTAYVYALVNLPSSTVLPDLDDATLDALKEIWVEDNGFTSAGVPDSFVMRGGNTVTLTGRGREALIKGCIPVERLASKVRLFTGIEDKIYLDADGKVIYQGENESDADFQARRDRDKAEVWEPRPTTTKEGASKENMWLFFTNLTRRGRIDGQMPDGEDLNYWSTGRSISDDSPARLVKTGVAIADYTGSAGTKEIRRTDFPYSHEVPYYSYPNSWKSDDILEQHGSYVVLRLTWERVWDRENGENNKIFENFYYQVPVNRLPTEEKGKDRLDPNTYYRIKIKLGMLGSKDLGSPLPITASWEAVPWVNETVDVNIKGRRYLVVNETEWVMNNVSSISIPYSSSHDVEISECYVNYFRYNDVWGSQDHTGDPGHNKREFETWVSRADAEIKDKGKEGEGLLKGNDGKGITVDDIENEVLYYKKEYFYDPYVNNGSGGYEYYFGHEHPKTYQPDHIARPSGISGSDLDAWQTYHDTYGLDSIYRCKLDEKRNVINFYHPLVQWKEVRTGGEGKGAVKHYIPVMNTDDVGRNSFDEEFSRIEIVIKIRHKDWDKNDDLFEEIIHITQYPSLYVEVSHDYGSVSITTGSNRSKGNEYVWVNNTNTHGSYWYQVSEILDNYGDINNNPNMYVIHTSQLSESYKGKYILGDPRKLYYNNDLDGEQILATTPVEFNKYNDQETWWGYEAGAYGVRTTHYETVRSATRIEDNTTGIMKYYYPTDETTGNGSKENFIAPSFRIASSLGKTALGWDEAYRYPFTPREYMTESVSKTQARRRCAAYQEAGRPAGRWRVPTMAEIEYVVSLSAQKKIPALFGIEKGDSFFATSKSAPYWSASGMLGIDAYTSEITELTMSDLKTDPAVRCVYDEWYWTQIDGGEFPEVIKKNGGPLCTTFYWGDLPKDNTQVKFQAKPKRAYRKR